MMLKMCLYKVKCPIKKLKESQLVSLLFQCLIIHHCLCWGNYLLVAGDSLLPKQVDFNKAPSLCWLKERILASHWKSQLSMKNSFTQQYWYSSTSMWIKKIRLRKQKNASIGSVGILLEIFFSINIDWKVYELIILFPTG